MSDKNSASQAATVMLLRDGEQGLEVFMVERHHKSNAFAAMLVFPGGKVDLNDAGSDVKANCAGSNNISEQQFPFAVAAAREAFEESGVLLATDNNGKPVPSEKLLALQPFRQALNNGELSFGQFLQQHGLLLQLGELVHYSHWITPEFEPRRFNTHFYLARMPDRQELKHDGSETVSSLWITPSDALRDAAAGERRVIFPTLRNLERLAACKTVDEALLAAKQVQVHPIQPHLDEREDGLYIVMGDYPEYPVNEERLSDEMVALFMGSKK